MLERASTWLADKLLVIYGAVDAVTTAVTTGDSELNQSFPQ